MPAAIDAWTRSLEIKPGADAVRAKLLEHAPELAAELPPKPTAEDPPQPAAPSLDLEREAEPESMEDPLSTQHEHERLEIAPAPGAPGGATP